MAGGGNKKQDEKINVNFESHPPIETDLEGIATLLKQTILHYSDCTSLASYLIHLREVTQVIAIEDGSATSEEEEDEDDPNNNIFGVTSIIDLSACFNEIQFEVESEARKQLIKFFMDKSPVIRSLFERSKTEKDSKTNIAVIINERYINLPAQLSLPTLKDLESHLEEIKYTHLILLSKILLTARSTDTKLPSKRNKSSSSSKSQADVEPIIYVNPEEEIIFEGCSHYVDVDVSSFCDENASWSAGSDVKYIPHRRIMLIDYKNWPTIMKNLEKELRMDN